MKKYFYIVVLLILVGTISWLGIRFGLQTRPETKTEHAYLQANDRCLRLAVADTPTDRKRGLSGYKSLDQNEGMLFSYNQAGNYGFWMKDMSFPIDIIWLDEDNKTITIKSNVSPTSYPETFYPTKPAKNVVEVASGTADKLNIKSGNRLKISAPTTTQPVGC